MVPSGLYGSTLGAEAFGIRWIGSAYGASTCLVGFRRGCCRLGPKIRRPRAAENRPALSQARRFADPDGGRRGQRGKKERQHPLCYRGGRFPRQNSARVADSTDEGGQNPAAEFAAVQIRREEWPSRAEFPGQETSASHPHCGDQALVRRHLEDRSGRKPGAGGIFPESQRFQSGLLLPGILTALGGVGFGCVVDAASPRGVEDKI